MALLRELFVGLACGFVFQVYYYMLFFAGDWMDMHFGMSMAKVFDPGTSIQASMSETCSIPCFCSISLPQTAISC